MKARCNNAANKNYPSYGGKGIGVCDRWCRFEEFFADMGAKPSALHSLDRIDGSGNYEPGNCRWATALMQSRNRRHLKLFEMGDEKKTLVQWAELHGVPTRLVRERVVIQGWPLDLALTSPVDPYVKRVRRAGIKLSLADVSEIKALLRKGVAPFAIARTFSVNSALVYRIRDGKAWACASEGSP